MLAYVTVLVALIGLLLWGLGRYALVKEAGRLAYFVGLLWLVYSLLGRSVRVF